MSIRTTIALVLVLAACIGLAYLFVDEPHIFIGRKFLDLVQWIAFWR